MVDFNTIINNIRSISLEDLSDKELDTLKDEIIKLLVDIQIQKDINTQIKAHHTSTDDIQIEIMQKTSIALSEQNEKPNPQLEVQSQKDNPASEYQNILQQTISEEVISVYSEKSNRLTNTDTALIENTENTESEREKTNLSTSIEKIHFSINDKFRIIRKLFNNNTEKFNAFIAQLNNLQDICASENYIQETADLNLWDKESFEYKILIRQNAQRFK